MIARALVQAPLGRPRAGRIEVAENGQWRGSRGLGESHAAGALDCHDLVTLVRIAVAPLRNAVASGTRLNPEQVSRVLLEASARAPAARTS